MKTALLTFAIVSFSLGVFGQAKISLSNDSSHLVYLGQLLRAADAAFVQQAVPTNPLPSGVTLLVDLYGCTGTNAAAMTLQKTVPMNASLAGRFASANLISTNIPGGGTLATLQLKVRESTFPTAEAAQISGGYFGFSQIFTILAASGISYPGILPGGAAQSTWTNGTFDLLPLGYGAIEVGLGSSELSPPIIYSPPSSDSYLVGTNVVLSVGVAGTGPLSYQWRKNAVVFDGATNSTLTFTNVALTDAGRYDLVITNYLGTATSIVAIVQVLPTNAPSIRVNSQLAVGTVTAAGPADISINGGFSDGFIFYTLDGNTPTAGSALYNGSFSIANSLTLRAMSLSGDFSQSSEAPAVNVVVPPSYSLSTSVSGSGTIDRNPSGNSYVSNSVVVFTASAAAHWAFDRWTGDLTGSANPDSITMNGPRSVQAVFVPTAFPLTLGTPGGGNVTANGQVIAANTYYPTGSVVQLQATPDSGWTFLNWQGSAVSTANPFGLVMNQTQNVQAVFGTVVMTNIGGNGSIVMSATNPVPYGTILTNSAVPAPGHRFVTWSGAVSGTNNPVTLTVTAATPTVGALFVPSAATGGQLKNPRKIASDFVCDLVGTASRNYQIRHSTNLADWSDLLILTNLTGTVSFTNPIGGGSRYYRAMLLP